VPGIGWGVLVAQPVVELHQRADSIRTFVLVVIAAGVLLAALIGSMVSMHMTRPLRAIARAAGRMAKGDLSARALVHASPFLPRELGDLQRTFNVMAEAVEHSRREQATARRKAEDANRSKSEFLANMGHELRTPLNAILGFSDMMLSGTFGPLGSPRYRDYLEYIQSSARHLLSLMNGLLDHARIEAGALRLEEAFLDIGEVMQTSAAMFRDSARRGSIGFRVLPPKPQVHLFADERAMRQILINLLSNAVRYTPAGGQVTLAAELGPAGELAIYVADTGPGIPEDDLARVLEPFERVQRRDGRNIEGTGLGLPIVKQLVERQGGLFELHSVEGEGTVARSVFPRERVTHERASANNG
jgi:signal transduction histidine kinase